MDFLGVKKTRKRLFLWRYKTPPFFSWARGPPLKGQTFQTEFPHPIGFVRSAPGSENSGRNAKPRCWNPQDGTLLGCPVGS